MDWTCKSAKRPASYDIRLSLDQIHGSSDEEESDSDGGGCKPDEDSDHQILTTMTTTTAPTLHFTYKSTHDAPLVDAPTLPTIRPTPIYLTNPLIKSKYLTPRTFISKLCLLSSPLAPGVSCLTSEHLPPSMHGWEAHPPRKNSSRSSRFRGGERKLHRFGQNT
jgi:hypothetical protein